MLTVALTGAATAIYAQSDSSTLFFQKAMEEKTKGRVMESYKALDKAYQYNSKDPQVVRELADALFALRRYGQAREKYQQLEAGGAADAVLYKKLLDLSFNMRQQNDVLRYAALLKKADPSQKIAFAVGKVHYDNENYGEAIRYLNEAIQEEPANSEAPYLIARAYTDMGNYKQALPYFEKTLALDPANTRLMYEMGLIYYSNYDNANSVKYLLMAGEKGYKRDNEYMENLAIAYLAANKFNEGLGILKEALSRRPSDVNLLNMMAEACYDAKRFDEAIGYWDQLLALDKKNASALYMIGLSYQKKGEKAKGVDLCDKAIQMDPSLASKKQKMEMPGM